MKGEKEKEEGREGKRKGGWEKGVKEEWGKVKRGKEREETRSAKGESEREKGGK